MILEELPDEILLRITSGRARKPKRVKPSRVTSFVKRGSPAIRSTRMFNGRKSILKISKFNAPRLMGGAAKAHLRYLLREGATNTLGPEARTAGTVPLTDFEVLKQGEKRHFRAILSAGEDFFVHSEIYLHAVMARLERGAGRYGTGQRLSWTAIRHDNTDNPHWHIIIHGLDADGKDVYFGRPLVTSSSLMATEVQQNLTGGIVLGQKVLAERNRAPTWETMKGLSHKNLDRIIEEKGSGLTRKQLLDEVSPARQLAMHTRLLRHESAGLVRWKEEGRLEVAQNFSSVHRAQQRLLRAVASANVTLHTDPSSIRLVDNQANPKWSKRGVLTRRVRLLPRGDVYLLVEGVDDKPYLVRVGEGIERVPPVGTLVRFVGKGLRVIEKYQPDIRTLESRKGGVVLRSFGSRIYESLDAEVVIEMDSAPPPSDRGGTLERHLPQTPRTRSRDSFGW